MDTFTRTRPVISTTAERFIAYYGPGKYYVFRNLGPARLTVSVWGNPTVPKQDFELRGGDCVELFCVIAEVQISTQNTTGFDASVLEWVPVD